MITVLPANCNENKIQTSDEYVCILNCTLLYFFAWPGCLTESFTQRDLTGVFLERKQALPKSIQYIPRKSQCRYYLPGLQQYFSSQIAERMTQSAYIATVIIACHCFVSCNEGVRRLRRLGCLGRLGLLPRPYQSRHRVKMLFRNYGRCRQLLRNAKARH